ncbi:hypothetical protein AYI68_g2626 [Smittium mucronatum]|uniref:Uncharacterized protein n=1 Tax=Smittium mucronatum TaxID=133383 RepID=A0A1R0H255_9FUNG|nr:hypothetical protein AYI68_g2626 [Smittium mucronatum]
MYSNFNEEPDLLKSECLQIYPALKSLHRYPSLEKTEFVPYNRIYESSSAFQISYLTTNHEKYHISVEVIPLSSSKGSTFSVLVSGEAEFHNQPDDFNKDLKIHNCNCSIVVPLKFSSLNRLPRGCNHLDAHIYYKDDFFIVSFPKSGPEFNHHNRLQRRDSGTHLSRVNVSVSTSKPAQISFDRDIITSDFEYEYSADDSSSSLSIWSILGICILLVLIFVYWIDMSYRYLIRLISISRIVPSLPSFNISSLFSSSCPKSNCTLPLK